MQNNVTLDFGYPWWLSYGHVVLLIPALAALGVGAARKWPRWMLATLGVTALWSAASLVVLRNFNADGRAAMPTENFLKSGAGKVLDIGAGTGRSSIMVLDARPQATLVALDRFGESFEHHFGHGHEPEQRLLSNLQAAGVERRASIVSADMRKLPFNDASFDGVVSAYAMDHLPREGSKQALAEAARVLKPGGDFLLMLVYNDRWTRFAFGPALSHGGTRPSSWWRASLEEAGFRVLEEGTRPATLYFLLRR
ncbi:MAG: class I SAM-dependent methyltransferase [Bryobacterales bacterium]|nr:class I SAM-dependent methyltransferase [Bryobacterales bacterium]